LTARTVPGLGGDAGSVSWAWTATEIHTQSLRLDVFALAVLEDADPSTNIIAASAVTGTPVGGITPVVRIRRAVQTDGVMYSLDAGPAALFAVNTASGVIFAARQFTEGDVRAYPVTLTASHTSGTASLPLDIEVRSGVSICDRTPAVRDEILRVLNSRYTCDVVPPAALASIDTLAIPRRHVDTLLADDFAGMPALTTLTLAGLDLTGLPEGVFRGTTGLRTLNLAENRLASLPPDIFMNLGELRGLDLTGLAATGLTESVFSGLLNLEELVLLESALTSLPPGIIRNLGMLRYMELSLSNDLTELPAPLLADLEKIHPVVSFGLDTEASRRFSGITTSRRIGGIRYRVDGAPATALTLNEGASRNLQIEAVGDIRSTLTLVFRASAGSRLTAAPPVIRLTPSRRTTDVTLAAPADLGAGDRSGPVSWAWTSFLGNGLTELPAPDMRVTVRDTHRFEDADPAPNRIGETAPAGAAVSGWSPRVLVGGIAEANVRYSLAPDAGPFGIDAASGALSPAPGQALNHATTPAYSVTVIAQTPSGVTGSLAAAIEVFTLALEDAEPAANTIAATAPPGTPVSGVRPVLLVDGAAVADGVFYTLTGSGLFTVATASGMISSVGVLGGAGVHPVTLTATYRGAPADLPLTITVHAEGSLNICARTPVVQMEILHRINTSTGVRNPAIAYACAAVPTTRMASVRFLDFSRYTTSVETLLAGDFDGLAGLTSLTLAPLGLRHLPPGVFSGLPNLVNLPLVDNSLASLPPDVFSGLSRLRSLGLQFNADLKLPAQAVADLEGLDSLASLIIDRADVPDFRISGFRYHAPQPEGVPDDVDLQAVVFEEGEGRDVRLEVVGGVRSTLTLVLRVEGGSPLTVTPTTVRFSPLSNTDTAVVRVAAPVDDTVDPVYAWVSWAWTATGTEIRTQRLGVVVSDDNGLVDIDRAANRISEAAAPGDPVSGWSLQTLVDGVDAIADGFLPYRYSLSSDAGGLFQIHPVSGTLSLAPGRMLDYETSTAHIVGVVSRLDRTEWRLTATIFVDNAPELSLSGAVTGSISETAATGTAVSGIGVSLLDDGVRVPPFTGVAWSLPDAGSRVFQPEPVHSSSVVVLRLAGALDYETTPVHTLTLRADYLGGFATTQITVQVLNAVERLILEAVGTTPFRIGEGAQLGARAGGVRVTDEAGNELAGAVFDLQDGGEKFELVSNGDILVADQLDFEASTSHTLLITARREGLVSNQLRVDIAVVDSPDDLQLVDQSGARNIAFNTTGGQVRGIDLVFQIDGVNQVGTASAWHLPSDAGLFDIDSATGVITLREYHEFAPADFDIFVRATWTGADGAAPGTPEPLPLNIEINDGVPVRIRVFLEGAVIP